MELEYLLRDSVVLLASAVVVLLVTARLRTPPVLALLLTGLLIGPSGLGWRLRHRAFEHRAPRRSEPGPTK